MSFSNQIPSAAEKMVQQPPRREFEFPAETTTSRVSSKMVDENEFYRKILLSYIYPEGHEWFIISLNTLTFIFGVLGEQSDSLQI